MDRIARPMPIKMIARVVSVVPPGARQSDWRYGLFILGAVIAMYMGNQR